MSRVGSSAIAIPSGVTVSQQDGLVVVKGKNGELSAPLHSEVELVVADDVATVKPRRKTKLSQSLWGTMRATINNMVVGVGEGFSRKLEINGVGYRAAMQGNKLVLSLGYSHPVEMDVPAGLTVAVENNTQINISGADKQLLGQFASEVRSKRRSEHWVVVSGVAKVTNGDETFLLKKNESTYIPVGSIHSLENPTEDYLELIEVQSGSYLGEDDIVRFEDNYGRA
jgi:large subunit ribosomal protein L6